MRYADQYDDRPIYLDGTKMTEQICLRMRIGGQEGWYPIVAWGTHWYEADGQWEVILEDTSDIEIHMTERILKLRQCHWKNCRNEQIILCVFRLKSCLWMSVPAGCVLKMLVSENFIRHRIFR